MFTTGLNECPTSKCTKTKILTPVAIYFYPYIGQVFSLALTSLSVFRRLGWLGQLQGSCADRVPLLREGGHLAWLGSCVVMLKPYRCQVPTVLELTLRWILKTIQIDLSFWKVFRVKREETMKCLQFSPPLPEIRCLQSSLALSHYRQWVLQGQD